MEMEISGGKKLHSLQDYKIFNFKENLELIYCSNNATCTYPCSTFVLENELHIN